MNLLLERKVSIVPGLGQGGEKAIAAAILELDPEGQFVALDLDARRVHYSEEMVAHENIGVFSGEEEIVRAYVVAWLCTVGGYSPKNIELEKRYNIGRDGSVELDVLIKHPDGLPYALIELKSPGDFRGVDDTRIDGQLFGPAPHEYGSSVLVYATVECAAAGEPTIRAITIPYHAGLTYAQWSADRSYDTAIPVNYGDPVHEHYVRGGARDLRTSISRTELDRMRGQLHNKLWGGSRDDNAIYAYVVKLFLTKIHDERSTSAGERYSFQILYTGSRRENPHETFKRINARYLEAYRRYISPDDIEPLNESDFSAVELAWVVELLQDVSLTAAGQNTGDILGGFFEAITQEGFKQSKGLFFTHYNIAVFMTAVLEIPELAVQKLQSPNHPNERLPYIVDTSSGSGTFLLAAMRMVTDHITARRDELSTNTDVSDELTAKFPLSKPTQWAKDFIYGIEKREDLTISSKVNMVLHHDGSTNIYRSDGLRPLSQYKASRFRPVQRKPGEVGTEHPPGYDHPVAETFDVVITNPPFSTTLDATTKASLASSFELAADPNSENLFLERWYQLLRPGGRLGAVMPESFFSTAENVKARLFLLAHFNVKAVVMLPPHAFQPWTPTRTSLLFAQKKTRQEEADWAAIHVAEKTRMATALSEASTSLRKLKKPGKRTTAEQLAALRKTLESACKTLEIPTGQLSSVEELDVVAASLKSMTVELEAFRRTSRCVTIPDYTGVTVSEIGYKRTKRAEQPRPNYLFRAEVEGSSPVRVLKNLNDAPDGWKLVVSNDQEDALSKLREANLWA